MKISYKQSNIEKVVIETTSNTKKIGGKTFAVTKVLPPIRMYFAFVCCLTVCCLMSVPVSALTSLNTSNTNVVKNGLVGYWTFDGKNMTNATATDMSGGGTNGTLTNMTQTSAKTIGKIGQGLRFDGVDDYINLGTGTLGIPAGSTAMSISAWVKVSAYQSYAAVIGKGRSDAPYGGWQLNTNADTGGSRFDFALNISGVWSSSIINGAPGQNYATGKWYHVVGTYDGTTIKVYVNGVLDSSVVVPGTIQYAVGDSAANVLLGRNPGFSGANNHFNGIIDDVRVYNRALSVSEVQALYKAGGGVLAATVPGKSSTGSNSVGINSGLVGYWTFDGKNMTNATATDISGRGNDGTLSGTTVSTSKTIGKIGQALTFDSVDDKVTGTSSASLTLTTGLTISAWINPKSSGGNLRGRIFDKNQSSTGYNFFLDSSNYSATGLAFAVNGSAANTSGFQGVGNVITLNKWQHVVATLSAGNLLRLYVNGVKVLESAGFDVPGSGSDPFGIGGRLVDNARNFDGKIDDVRVYNRDLSTTEVQSLYKAGGGALTATTPGTSNSVGINSGLVGYWTFDGKNMTNATATDSSGNSKDGMLTNMTATSSVTQGKIGQAINFDNINDYITVPNFQISNGALTICAWIKPNSKSSSAYGRIVTSSIENTNFLIDTTDRIAFTSNSSTIIYSPTLSYGKWIHTCATRDATGASSFIYQNGVQSASGNTGTPGANGTTAYFGGRGGGDRTFDGRIDDVRIYNRQLTASEIYKIYKLGSQ